MKHFVYSLCLVLVLSVSVSGAAQTRIVFCSDRDGDNEVYVMDSDGGNVGQITTDTYDNMHAACSPDGRRILFVSDRDGNYEIYIMNSDGSGLLRLTNDPGQDLGPSWSRDGSKIAFTSDRDGDMEIFVMNPDGSGLQQLTFNSAADAFQDWSPNGSKIVFDSDRNGNSEIWVMNSDGSAPLNLTNISAADYMPEWSPDGSQIVFESVRHGPLELYTMNANGSNVQRLTYTYTDNHEADWSPDGSRIIFASNYGGNYEVLVINPDGTGLQNLTSHGATDWSPSWLPAAIPDSLNGGGTGVIAYCYQPMSGPDVHQLYTINLDGTENRKISSGTIGLNHHEWSPDGQKLAAVGYINASTWSIHVLDADGSNLTRLTLAPGVWDNEPSWSPDGEKIAWGRIYPSQGYRSEVWMMNADGSDQHYVGVEGDGVRWSPSGARLLYFKEGANVDLFTCNPDGTDEQQLTFEFSDEIAPDWSPDGTKIVFVTTRDGNHEIYVMNSDGSNQRRLTNSSIDEFVPTWSPDGSLIAFSGEVLAGMMDWEVFVMDSTGADRRRVTHMPAGVTAINPDWQPTDSSGVPVYLASFDCKRENDSVRFRWEVREDAAAADFRLVADGEGRWRNISVSPTGPRGFEAVDEHPSLSAGGKVVYRLYSFGDDNQLDLLRTEVLEFETPRAGAKLLGVYPNPFNPRTTVSFALGSPQKVSLEIHDAAGRRVTTLDDREYPAGDHHIEWDGRDAVGREVSSGIYFLRFKAGKSIESRKLVFIK